MFKQLTNIFAKDELVKVKTVKRTVETRGRKSLSKKQKVLNLLSKGDNVAWSTIQTRFELESPRSMIDTLRAEGYMIYGNKVNGKKYEAEYNEGLSTRESQREQGFRLRTLNLSYRTELSNSEYTLA